MTTIVAQLDHAHRQRLPFVVLADERVADRQLGVGRKGRTRHAEHALGVGHAIAFLWLHDHVLDVARGQPRQLLLEARYDLAGAV